jgi:hypothetical protein
LNNRATLASLSSLSRGATGRRTLAAAAPPLAATILPRRRLSWPPEVRAARGEGGGVAPILLPGGSRWPRPPGPPRTARRRGHPLRRQWLPSPDPAALHSSCWRCWVRCRRGGGAGVVCAVVLASVQGHIHGAVVETWSVANHLPSRRCRRRRGAFFVTSLSVCSRPGMSGESLRRHSSRWRW